MTHGYATQARCFHVKYTHRYILYTHTTMRYRCEILNHGIDGYEVWLHGRNQGRSGVKTQLSIKIYTKTHKIALYFIFIHRENAMKAHQYISYCLIKISPLKKQI